MYGSLVPRPGDTDREKNKQPSGSPGTMWKFLVSRVGTAVLHADNPCMSHTRWAPWSLGTLVPRDPKDPGPQGPWSLWTLRTTNNGRVIRVHGT